MNTDQSNKSRCILICILIITNVMSLVSLCISLPRASNLDIDYLGLIVGILAILVTVLIGWNIFKSVDLKKYIEQHDNVIKELEKQRKLNEELQIKYDSEKNLALSDLYTKANYLLYDDGRENDYKGIRYGIKYIEQQLSLGNEKAVNGYIENLLAFYSRISGLKIKKANKEHLLDKIESLNYGKETYQSIERLREFINGTVVLDEQQSDLLVKSTIP